MQKFKLKDFFRVLGWYEIWEYAFDVKILKKCTHTHFWPKMTIYLRSSFHITFTIGVFWAHWVIWRILHQTPSQPQNKVLWHKKIPVPVPSETPGWIKNLFISNGIQLLYFECRVTLMPWSKSYLIVTFT